VIVFAHAGYRRDSSRSAEAALCEARPLMCQRPGRAPARAAQPTRCRPGRVQRAGRPPAAWPVVREGLVGCAGARSRVL